LRQPAEMSLKKRENLFGQMRDLPRKPPNRNR
jgi:hypothetical protein